MMPIKYNEISEFNGIYLEDSFVTSIVEKNDSLIFNLEAVLTGEHPQYQSPLKNEQYCYKKITISFLNVTKLNWIYKNMVATTDADNEIDYGNIDTFTKVDNCYHLTGDWGEIEIYSGEPVVT